MRFPLDTMSYYCGVRLLVIMGVIGQLLLAQFNTATAAPKDATPVTEEAVQALSPVGLPTVDLLVAPMPFEEGTRQEALAVFPFGQPAADFLANATWFLHPNGSFVVKPAPSETILLTRSWVMGSHKLEGERRALHGSLSEGSGITSSLDGWLTPTRGGYQLDAIQVVTWRGHSQVQRVRQILRQGPHAVEPNSIDWTAVANFSRALNAVNIASEKTLSTQQDYLNGVPLLTSYGVTLQGTVDGVAFGPLEAFLQIGTSERRGGGRFGVMLATNGFERTGALVWSNQGSAKPDRNRAVEPLLGTVDVRNGQATAVLKGPDAGRLGSSAWRTQEATGPHANDESQFVAMSEGTVTFRIDGETIQGQVRGTGLRQPMLRVPSTYAASFAGRRRASKMVQSQQTATGLHRFDGLWRSEDATVGQLRLEQARGRLAGSFGEQGGRVEGTVEGDWASIGLHLKEPAACGFLRAVPGGAHLVGYLIRSGETTPEPLILTRGSPPPMPGQAVTKDDIRAARTLATDLARVGKCRQAIDSLSPIFERYYHDADAALINPDLRIWEKEEYLTQLSFALQPLIDCSYQLGDYHSLVRRLREALAVRNAYSPEADMRRLLEDQTKKSKDHAAGEAKTLSLLTVNIEDLRRTLDLGGTGIDFEGAEAGGNLTVTNVAPGRPAAAAGIVPGDVLVATDSKSLAGLDTASVTARLRGPVGSSIRVVVRRGEQRLEFTMARDPINRLAPARRDEIARALDEEMAGLERARAILANIPTVTTPVRTTGGPQALRHLQTDLAARAAELLVIQRATVDRLHALYHDQPDILEHVDRVFKFSESSRLQRGQTDVAQARSAEADENAALDLLKNRVTMAYVERSLLWQQIVLVADISTVISGFTATGESIDKLEVEKRYRDQAERTRDAVIQLSKWLEQWRQHLLTDSAKIAALEAGELYYDDAVAVFLELGSPEEALVMAEASRARAFADLIAGRIAKRGRAEATVVGTAVLNEANAPPATLAELKETIRELRATTVEYHLLLDRLVTWVISPGGHVEVRSLPLDRAELERSVAELLRLIETPLPNPPAPDDVDALIAARDVQLHQLYTWLIAPIQDLLPSSAEETVAIIPHRELFRLPFAALKDDAGRYLIQRHPLVYETSITVARYASRNKMTERQTTPNLLAFINPKPLVGPDGQVLSYGPLDWTEANINVLATRYGLAHVSVKKGLEATVNMLRQEAGHYDVIYLATHGKASDSDALDKTFIALAGQALTVLDVFRGKFETHAELVILGACETGGGRISGDGVNNLGRAFTYAGAETLMTTLWIVSEQTTLDFLNIFHEAWLARRLSKVHAAREAQLALMAAYPKQIDVWAPIVMFGVGR